MFNWLDKVRLNKVLISYNHKCCQKAETFSQGPLKLTCAEYYFDQFVLIMGFEFQIKSFIMYFTLWVNFINVLRAVQARADPKSIKKTHNLTVFFGIWACKNCTQNIDEIDPRCYLSWRRHNVLPDDEDHPYLNVIILANEIVLGEAYNKSSSPQGTESSSRVTLRFTKSGNIKLKKNLSKKIVDIKKSVKQTQKF